VAFVTSAVQRESPYKIYIIKIKKKYIFVYEKTFQAKKNPCKYEKAFSKTAFSRSFYALEFVLDFTCCEIDDVEHFFFLNSAYDGIKKQRSTSKLYVINTQRVKFKPIFFVVVVSNNVHLRPTEKKLLSKLKKKRLCKY